MSEQRPRKRRRIVVIGAGLAAAAVVASVAVGAALPQSTDYESYSPLVGKPAPALSGTTLIGHHRVNLASLRGHYVVVNFFASWCAPCGEEAPYLEQFAYESGRAGTATLVGVEFDDVDSTAASFLRETGATFPAISDPGEKIALAFGVKGPPETFVISPTGTVVAHVSGPVTDTGLTAVLSTVARSGR